VPWVGLHRSTQRLDSPVPAADDERLGAWLGAFSTTRPRWGWRRAAKGLCKEGWAIHKRVQRLWRQEGLKLPYRKPKKRLTGLGTHVGAMCPIARRMPCGRWTSRSTSPSNGEP
jgi:putative transposase